LKPASSRKVIKKFLQIAAPTQKNIERENEEKKIKN
jgi:hypothetical protein